MGKYWRCQLPEEPAPCRLSTKVTFSPGFRSQGYSRKNWRPLFGSVALAVAVPVKPPHLAPATEPPFEPAEGAAVWQAASRAPAASTARLFRVADMIVSPERRSTGACWGGSYHRQGEQSMR